MRKFLVLVFLAVTGCGTFAMRNIHQSEASLEHAKTVFATYDYSKAVKLMTPAQADVKTIGPVQLYSSTDDLLLAEQNGWNYMQRVNLVDGVECFSYVQVTKEKNKSLRTRTGSMYCFQDELKYTKVKL